MCKYYSVLAMTIFMFSCGAADTFVNRQGGESFNGYATQIKNGAARQVRVENRGQRTLNLSEYEIQPNYLGRKNTVYGFSIKEPLNLIAEAEAFEQAIALASNQGPFFILIEIDAPGGKVELARRFCEAIIKTDNCVTVALVGGGKYGGRTASDRRFGGPLCKPDSGPYRSGISSSPILRAPASTF